MQSTLLLKDLRKGNREGLVQNNLRKAKGEFESSIVIVACPRSTKINITKIRPLDYSDQWPISIYSLYSHSRIVPQVAATSVHRRYRTPQCTHKQVRWPNPQ